MQRHSKLPNELKQAALASHSALPSVHSSTSPQEPLGPPKPDLQTQSKPGFGKKISFSGNFFNYFSLGRKKKFVFRKEEKKIKKEVSFRALIKAAGDIDAAHVRVASLNGLSALVDIVTIIRATTALVSQLALTAPTAVHIDTSCDKQGSARIFLILRFLKQNL